MGKEIICDRCATLDVITAYLVTIDLRKSHQHDRTVRQKPADRSHSERADAHISHTNEGMLENSSVAYRIGVPTKKARSRTPRHT